MNIAESPKSPGRLRVLISGGVCWISIDNPGKHNAISLGMWEDLSAQVHRAVADDQVRVIVLQGTGGKSFSAGADISEFAVLRSTPAQVLRYNQAVDDAQDALAHSDKPTVAVIQGICMGGGMELAAVCDFRYAGTSARFRMSAALMGLGYSLKGIANMVEVLGVPRSKDIFMTARDFGAIEAVNIGFVHQVFPEDEFDASVRERVSVLARNAPLTLKAIKLAMRHAAGQPKAPGRAEVDGAIKACFDSDDYKEGQNAFREKRLPVFRGR